MIVTIWFDVFPHFHQDALNAELNNFGKAYGKEFVEKKHLDSSDDQKSPSSQTFVEQEQFLR